MKALRPKLHPLTQSHNTPLNSKKKKKKKRLVASDVNQTVLSWTSGRFLTKLYAYTQRSFSLLVSFFSFLSSSITLHSSMPAHTESVYDYPLPQTSLRLGKTDLEGNQSEERKKRHTQLSILTADTNTESCWWSAGMFTQHIVYRNGKGLFACSNLIGWLKIK